MMPSSKGRPELVGEADRGRNAAVGHRHDKVGLGRCLAGELGADALADRIDAPALDAAVRPGEVDILEHAEAPRGGRERMKAAHPSPIDDHDLARLDVPDEGGTDHVEGAGLRGEDDGTVELAQDQRPDAQGVAHADDAVVEEGHERPGPLDHLERLDEAGDDGLLPRAGDQMDDDLGVGRRLEDAALVDQPALEHVRVGEVAVVPEREAAEGEVREERLHVAETRSTRRGVPGMADGGMARQLADDRLAREVVADEARGPVAVELAPVEGDDAGRLLAPVLQRVQAQGGERRRLGVAVDREDPALLLGLVVVLGGDALGVGQVIPHRCSPHPRAHFCFERSWSSF